MTAAIDGDAPTPRQIESEIKFVEETNHGFPRELLVKASELIPLQRRVSALDAGAGALNDTRYLLETGYQHVTAIAPTLAAIDIADELSIRFVGKLEYKQATFQTYEFGIDRFDLVNAQYSLQYVNTGDLPSLINKIYESLRPGGYFTGTFFLNEHEWNIPTSKLFFLTPQQASKLFSRFKIIDSKERQFDAKPAVGDKVVHWHILEFIVKK